jgi:hypothetical protein
MSEMYGIKETTLTALGDAVRDKVGQTKVILKTSDNVPFFFDRPNNGSSAWGAGDKQWNIANVKSIKIKVNLVKHTGDYRVTVWWKNNVGNIQDFNNPADGAEFTINNKFDGWVKISITAESYCKYAEGSVDVYFYDADGNPTGEPIEVKNTMTVEQMTNAITAIPSQSAIEEAIEEYKANNPVPPDSAFTIKGDCAKRFANRGWDWFMNLYGDKITTENISSMVEMFYPSDVEQIPFDINGSNSYTSMNGMFKQCVNLKEIPKIVAVPYDMDDMFQQCYSIRYLPEDFVENLNWSTMETSTSSYSNAHDSMFYNCYSLRAIPSNLFARMNPNIGYNGSCFRNGFCQCFCLDELVDLEIPYKAKWNNNAFDGFVSNCARLKNFTFAKQSTGEPYVMQWKSQTIDLSTVGFCGSSGVANSYVLRYNGGITSDKEVKDDATYQALKDDPDWYAIDVAYSRYNHDSAVATINSLPDTSAYLASSGGTNTIKFKGAAGEKTDGGAINTLTEEEIAVATAKGWTVQIV